MDISEFSNLLENYKQGKLLPQEKERLNDFLESFQTNPSEWVEHEMGKQGLIEERVFSRILKKIDGEKIQYVNRVFFSPSLFKRAAAIAFCLMLSSGILYISGVFSKKIAPVVWSEAITPPGEKSIVLLSDGSQITLNADSKLKYPDRFNGTMREVCLEGEGYFVVRHSHDQPFIVHTGNLSTTVLGTKFDISAYLESKTIAVSLLEGRVRVTRNGTGKVGSAVILEPREQLNYDKEHDVSSFDLFDSLEAFGWKDNIYRFENEPLAKVFSQLDRAYGVKFKIADQSLLAQRITVTFENKSLQTVIDVLENLTGLDHKIVTGEGKVLEVAFFRHAR